MIALGGNALTRPGQRGTAAEQRANLREACSALVPLLADPRLVVTHGNGPQVGNELVRQERAADEVPPLPLFLAVAQTQAEIGALLEAELMRAAGRPVACLLTHVIVDEHDPAFAEPTKPIGPFYGEERARELERERGWQLRHDAGRGYRRVVPSPEPLEIVELTAVRALLDAGTCAVACGGGGIPVARRDGGLAGVDAVVDKDRASALLAAELRAERLVIVTDVPAVLRDFGTEREEPIWTLSPGDADELAPELAAGSMRPKIEASAAFVRRTGGEALISSAETLAEALAGRGGTRILARGACAVILDDEGRVLLIKENYGKRRYGLPGGALEPGETPEDAVVREAREETSAQVEIDHLIGIYGFDNEWVIHAYRCRVVAGSPQLPGTGEIAEVGWFDPAEVPEWRTNSLHYALPDALAGRRGVVRENLPRVT